MRARAWLVAAMLFHASCSRGEDDACGRAFARIARLEAARHQAPMPAEFEAEALAACRKDPKGVWDPVVNCAMAAKSDDEAAACIDRGIREVVKGQGEGPAQGQGQGLNPLLGP